MNVLTVSEVRPHATAPNDRYGIGLNAQSVRDAARGKWRAVFGRLGIVVPPTPMQHGPCPTCGGKDRFRFDDLDGRGTWFCNQCDPHAGDGIALVQNIFECDLREALELVADEMNYSPSSIGNVPEAKPAEFSQQRLQNIKGEGEITNQASEKASQLWHNAKPAPADHPYLVKKGVSAHYLRLYRGELSIAELPMDGALIMPLRDEHDKLWSLEFIRRDGEKRFLPGGRKRGCFCLLGEIIETVCLAEGYATGASDHEATGFPVAIALDAGNLRPVAEALRAKHPSVHLIVCGDHDGKGIGQAKAQEAAQAVGGLVVLPDTPGEDWNDVHQRKGCEAVQRAIQSLQEPVIIPLDDVTLPDFPLEAFPNPLRSMIEAVATATETPVELGAMMGLGTVAACCQKVCEVKVEENYCEPLNLWVVAALESGNRKTAVHQEMTAPLRAKERELCEQSKASIEQAESTRVTIEARMKAIRARIANSEDNAEFAVGQRAIEELQASMPEIPVSPRLWAQDITPEKLGAVMAENGERLALLSDEAGLFDVLAGRYSHGVPNLDAFLQSHAAASVRVDRGSRPSLVMHRPALTIVLSPQPGVLRGLTGIPGFRGRGLLARFLYALPPSRLGYRQLRTEPVPTHVRTAYQQMVLALLACTPTRNEYGDTVASTIRLSPEAEREWREFAQCVEVNMRPQGAYEHLKDWAGKLPGAALRVAGLFHCVQYAQQQPWTVPLSFETMRAAITVLVVIGQHTRAVFDLMGADPALEGARKVWRWIETGRRHRITARECFESLRGSFPRMSDLNPAVSVLCERGYLLRDDNLRPGPGRRIRPLTVNPILTKGWV